MTKALVGYRDGGFVLMARRSSGEIYEVELSLEAVQILLFSASKALADQKANPDSDRLIQPPMIDAEPVALSTGSDNQGRTILTVELPLVPPMRFRFNDDMAQGIVENFRRILNAPLDVRRSIQTN